MKNYLILNGNISTNIKGLLISTLPPITKPSIRTQIEEIDGRDGDIITKLGYSAYDKSFEIGLYGDFDINEVIQYFNSEGTVTFSNEPDKYYNYEIIDQIDFEKLIRFKTATVTIHVQPFKYSAEDNSKTFIIDTDQETPQNSISIRNVGNIYSKPIITIQGSGTIALYLNNLSIFNIDLENLGSITIDTNKMEAYNGTQLLNRYVTGDYDNFNLKVGLNNISWTGDITSIEIQNYSRWI